MEPILLIVFLPLLAAIVGGLGNRALGNVAVKSITTGALFISCALSWPIFLSFLAGHAEAHVSPVLHWVTSGNLDFAWALRVDTLTAVMLVVVTTVLAMSASSVVTPKAASLVAYCCGSLVGLFDRKRTGMPRRRSSLISRAAPGNNSSPR